MARSYSNAAHPDFYDLRCSLGLLGVITSVTLKAVPRFKLKETHSVLSRREVREGHRERLAKYRHVRYHWIPFTDRGVVTTCALFDSKSESET